MKKLLTLLMIVVLLSVAVFAADEDFPVSEENLDPDPLPTTEMTDETMDAQASGGVDSDEDFPVSEENLDPDPLPTTEMTDETMDAAGLAMKSPGATPAILMIDIDRFLEEVDGELAELEVTQGDTTRDVEVPEGASETLVPQSYVDRLIAVEEELHLVTSNDVSIKGVNLDALTTDESQLLLNGLTDNEMRLLSSQGELNDLESTAMTYQPPTTEEMSGVDQETLLSQTALNAKMVDELLAQTQDDIDSVLLSIDMDDLTEEQAKRLKEVDSGLDDAGLQEVDAAVDASGVDASTVNPQDAGAPATIGSVETGGMNPTVMIVLVIVLLLAVGGGASVGAIALKRKVQGRKGKGGKPTQTTRPSGDPEKELADLEKRKAEGIKKCIEIGREMGESLEKDLAKKVSDLANEYAAYSEVLKETMPTALFAIPDDDKFREQFNDPQKRVEIDAEIQKIPILRYGDGKARDVEDVLGFAENLREKVLKPAGEHRKIDLSKDDLKPHWEAMIKLLTDSYAEELKKDSDRGKEHLKNIKELSKEEGDVVHEELKEHMQAVTDDKIPDDKKDKADLLGKELGILGQLLIQQQQACERGLSELDSIDRADTRTRKVMPAERYRRVIEEIRQLAIREIQARKDVETLRQSINQEKSIGELFTEPEKAELKRQGISIADAIPFRKRNPKRSLDDIIKMLKGQTGQSRADKIEELTKRGVDKDEAEAFLNANPNLFPDEIVTAIGEGKSPQNMVVN